MSRIMVTMTERAFSKRSENYDGICLACGKWQKGGCEPDAIGYPCKKCRENSVCGAEEALIMQRIDIK